MREVYRSAIAPYSAETMFNLIADIDSYSTFLPWCNESKILSSSDDGVEQEVVASLGLVQGALTGRFTTRNRNIRPSSILLTLIDGPFSDLEGEWKIQPLGDDGCKLELRMRFAFSNPLKDMLLGTVFEKTCNKLVDAFVTRAGQMHD
jgi:ribosome-associated toxin RatA of RatAB toxin-antitoxin module